MFFEADNGRKYPVSRVRSVERDWKNGKVIIELDDQVVTLPEHVWGDQLRRTITSFIPAAPGYILLTSVTYDDGEKYDQESVIGWALNVSGELIPVTSNGLSDAGHGVMTPEGRVVQPEMGSWDSLALYLESTGVPLAKLAA